jgi:hypothetical protein
MSFGPRAFANPMLGSGSHDPSVAEETMPGVWDAEMSMIHIADDQEKTAAPPLPKLKLTLSTFVVAISLVWEALQLLAMPARSWRGPGSILLFFFQFSCSKKLIFRAQHFQKLCGM